jgi:hypothetical protein
MRYQVCEGLKQNDLVRLVKPRFHIDEFKSKMGEDEDIVVLSFAVTSKNAAEDLVDFFEKGYDWVLDSDCSPGEFVKNIFLVFVEIERSKKLPMQIQQCLDDLAHLTGINNDEWATYYGKGKNLTKVDLNAMEQTVPLTPMDYRIHERDLEQLKNDAGININKQPVRDSELKQLQSAAGVI